MTILTSVSPLGAAMAGLATVVANWVLVSMLIEYAPRIGLLDRPNERSLHTKVTPRGGGVGLVLVFCAVLAASVGWGGIARDVAQPVTVYLCAALFIAAVSLRDDFKSLSPAVRFFCQLVVAGVAVGGIASFQLVTLPFFGPVDLGWAGPVLTVLWIVGLTNVYNFMDGSDGIAAVQGVTAGLAWTVAGFWGASPVIVLIGVLLAGGCAAFLIHNWSPAKIFMGDVGSAFLGYSFAVLPLLLLRSGVATQGRLEPGLMPVFALLVMWPFVGDGFYTFVRRARQGEAVWKPHRSHLYQRLVQSGWSHARVSTLYAAWCGLSALAGLCRLNGPGAIALVLSFGALGALSGVYLLVSFRERKVGKR